MSSIAIFQHDSSSFWNNNDYADSSAMTMFRGSSVEQPLSVVRTHRSGKLFRGS